MTRAIGILFLFCACAVAAPPAGYYSNAVGKTGQELRAALHGIISQGHVPIDYEDDARSAIEVLDQDPANPNNVWLLYAQRTEPKTNYDPGIGWNIEHLWPVSYGLTNKGPYYSDLHHLRAESSQANSSRGNKLFDETSPIQECWVPSNQYAPLCSSDCNSWEPPAVVKGDIARSLFYMDVRYATGPGWETNLMLTDIVSESTVKRT